MQTTECHREPDVLDAVLSGLWPSGLRAHAAGCPVCGDLATVVTLLAGEGGVAGRDARLPTSGQMWWRATMRNRAEGAVAASRPITAVQGVAGACAAGLFAALITLSWPFIQQPLRAMEVVLSRDGARLGAAAVSIGPVLALAIVVGGGLILGSFLLYFVVADD